MFAAAGSRSTVDKPSFRRCARQHSRAFRTSVPRTLCLLGVMLSLRQTPVALAQISGPVSAFTVGIELSKAASQELAARHEGMVVSAAYAGNPKAGARRHADQIGQINLGYDRVTVEGTSATVHVTGSGLRRPALAWVQGPVLLNVNVYTARRSSRDNLISCDFFDGELQHAVQSPMTLHCGLITERPKTTYFQ